MANAKKKAPKDRRTTGNRKGANQKTKVSNLLAKAIKSFETRIETEGLLSLPLRNTSKLVQLREEAQQESSEGDQGHVDRSDSDVRLREIKYVPLPSQREFHDSKHGLRGFPGRSKREELLFVKK